MQGALKRHLRKQGTVLDPFAGVGTTLIEAILAGCDAIGFEINPYAALACQTKLTAYRLCPDVIRKAIEEFQAFYSRAVKQNDTPFSNPPARFKTRAPFYSPQVLQKVLIVHDYTARLDDTTVRDLFRIAFASTMVSYSNYSYEPSLSRRVTAGKSDIEDFPVGQAISMKLHEMGPGYQLDARAVAWAGTEDSGIQ